MKIQFVNSKEVKGALNKVQKKFQADASKLIAGAAMRTVTIAKSRLQPLAGDDREMAFEIGGVRQSINFTFDKKTLSAAVFAGNTGDDHMAAYLEFGTGKFAAAHLASEDPWVRKLAMVFYVNGKGWLRAHPYFIGTYKQEGQRLSEKLKNLKVAW